MRNTLTQQSTKSSFETGGSIVSINDIEILDNKLLVSLNIKIRLKPLYYDCGRMNNNLIYIEFERYKPEKFIFMKNHEIINEDYFVKHRIPDIKALNEKFYLALFWIE